MEIAQKERYQGDDWWEWSVWIEASQSELAGIESVTWHLHPTFDPQQVETNDRAGNFALKSSGWGTFRIRATVRLVGGKTKNLAHELELTYPDGSPATA